MIDEILIAAEGTERDIAAVPVGAAIARQLGVPATLLSVVADAQRGEAQYDALVEKRRALDCEEVDIKVAANADVAACLIEALHARSGALACLWTHARTPVGEWVFGSVAEAVVREAHTPLLLLGPQMSPAWSPGIRTILLCVDTSALSEAIVPVAAELAVRTGAELRLVEMLDKIRMTATGASDVAGESSYLHELAEQLERDHGLQPSWEVLHGEDAGSVVADYAYGIQGALIAMATHGRAGLAQVIRGSATHRALRRAPCPVLVASPASA